MNLYIDRLLKSQELLCDFDSRDCRLPKEFGKLLTAVHLAAHVRKVEEEVRIEARLSADVEVPCSRCLKEHHLHIDEDVDLTYLPEPDDQEGAHEIELGETDLNVEFYTGDSIDLVELVREQVLLLLPVKPLCREDCAGLCQSCGQDLNEGTCTCPKEVLDPRFAALGKLLEQKTSGE